MKKEKNSLFIPLEFSEGKVCKTEAVTEIVNLRYRCCRVETSVPNFKRNRDTICFIYDEKLVVVQLLLCN